MPTQAELTWNWFIDRYQQMGYSSLTKFADATNMQKSSLSRYFHLQRQLPSGTMASLCKALKVSPNELMTVLGEEWN
jgi:hypothetical protein